MLMTQFRYKGTAQLAAISNNKNMLTGDDFKKICVEQAADADVYAQLFLKLANKGFMGALSDFNSTAR